MKVELNGARVLVLGGTGFLGPAIVGSLVARGHQVTLLNRGKTNPRLFPGLEKIRCDRRVGAKAYVELPERAWNAVIDVWPDDPQLVGDALEAIEAKHWVFVSSIAVYRSFVTVGLDESVARQGNINIFQPMAVKEKLMPAGYMSTTWDGVPLNTKAGDFIEFYAEIDLLVLAVHCPYGDQTGEPSLSGWRDRLNGSRVPSSGATHTSLL